VRVMKQIKVYPILCLALLLGLWFGLLGHPVAQAQSQDETEVKLELSCQYPVMSGVSGTSFEFTVQLNYEGSEALVFDLLAEGPKGWTVYIQPAYAQGGEQIQAIRLDPEKTYPESIKILLRSPLWASPEPGEYVATLEASSGDIKDNIELKASVTDKYDFRMSTPTGRLNTEAEAGKDSLFTIVLENSGTAPIENIELYSENKPSGWSMTFSPEEIDSLPPGSTQGVEVTIKPPPKTIAGDYEVSLRASGDQGSDFMYIRVTVLTPTLWGWVGIGIIIAVIAGLVVMFMRLGRR